MHLCRTGRPVRRLGLCHSVFDSVLRNRAGGDAVLPAIHCCLSRARWHRLETNDLNVHLMVLLMVIAAIVGDAVNYTIGRLFGEKLFSNPNSKIFRRSYLDKTHQLL